jgi:hypothetical protein
MVLARQRHQERLLDREELVQDVDLVNRAQVAAPNQPLNLDTTRLVRARVVSGWQLRTPGSRC